MEHLTNEQQRHRFGDGTYRIPQQIWSGPPDGTFDYCSDDWRSYTGLAPEELQGEGWQTVLHPDDRDRVLKAWHEAVANGLPYEQEERHRGADGTYRWFLVRGFPLRDDGGSILRWYGTSTDIEDLKRAENAQRQTEEQYRLIVETVTDAIISLDENSQILFVNPATTRIFGHESSGLIGKPLTLLMPGFLRELFHASLQRRLAANQRPMACQGMELLGLRKNGEQFPVEVSFAEMTEGRHIFTGFVRDITERKRAEEALRASEQEQRQIATQLERERGRLEEAQEVAKIGSWEAELQTLNVIWSEQTHRIFETDPSRFHPTRSKFWEFIHPEDRAKVDAAFLASLGKRSSCTVEYRIVMADGRFKILEDRWQAFRNEQGKPVRIAGTCRDITERVRAEEELRRLSGKILRLQDEERRKIARDLHDITGQDLVALATMLDQLQRLIPSRERRLRRTLSKSKTLAHQCIDQVRTLSYVLHPPVLDHIGLNEAIRDFAKGFTQRSGISVELELSPTLGRMARDIELALFRVVQESLTNVQRHSGSQQARIRLDRTSDLTLEISDLGQGAPGSVPRGNENRRLKVGVGIPSMRERVKLIGGRLDIESSNPGTTIRVTMPLPGEST